MLCYYYLRCIFENLSKSIVIMYLLINKYLESIQFFKDPHIFMAPYWMTPTNMILYTFISNPLFFLFLPDPRSLVGPTLNILEFYFQKLLVFFMTILSGIQLSYHFKNLHFNFSRNKYNWIVSTSNEMDSSPTCKGLQRKEAK